MAERISRSVGNPTAAVMRRTWRLRPSRIASSSKAVGMLLRSLMGGWRSYTCAGGSSRRALAGRVGPSLSPTPARKAARAFSVGVPST